MASSRVLVDISQLRQFTAVELLKDPGHDPSPKPIPQCMEVRLDYSLTTGKLAHNVLHGRFPTTYPGTAALANAIKASFVSLFGSSGLTPTIGTAITLNTVSLRDLSVLNALYVPSTSAASAIGSDATQLLPFETAAALTARTALSGPGGRGRMYMLGFTSGSLASGNLMGTVLTTALTQFAAGIPGVFSTNGLTNCLALPSRVAYTGSTGRQHPARPAGTADIVRWDLRDNHWDSQRRRGLK